MGGLELCKAIAAERPGVKALMMSGDRLGIEQARMNGLAFLQSRSPIRRFKIPLARCSVQSRLNVDRQAPATLPVPDPAYGARRRDAGGIASYL